MARSQSSRRQRTGSSRGSSGTARPDTPRSETVSTPEQSSSLGILVPGARLWYLRLVAHRLWKKRVAAPSSRPRCVFPGSSGSWRSSSCTSGCHSPTTSPNAPVLHGLGRLRWHNTEGENNARIAPRLLLFVVRVTLFCERTHKVRSDNYHPPTKVTCTCRCS